jgi:hypothetical protein
MNKISLIICLILSSVYCEAQTENSKGISLGLGAGYTNSQNIAPEAYLQWHFPVARRRFEVKGGVDYHAFDAKFNGLDGLKTKGAGLFAEAIIFPFHKYFYAGIRWDLITVNSLTKNTLNRMGSTNSSIVFSGSNFFGVAGVDFLLSRKIHFRLYGMPGVRQYKISDGTFSSGNYIVDGTTQESHYDFICQVNVGLVFRLK